MATAERRCWEQLQADRKAIDTAADWLRTPAWEEHYAGLHDQDRAFMIALLLDTLRLELDRIPPGVRAETVRVSRWLVGAARYLTPDGGLARSALWACRVRPASPRSGGDGGVGFRIGTDERRPGRA